jgi:glycosyltransferase involved in cell wall biosynthesis
MPTVCHLLHSLNVGGAEVLAARLGRDLCRQYRVVFGCLDDLGPLGEELRSEGFTVEILGRRSGLDWRCIGRLRAFLRREQASLIHAHQYTPFFYAVASRFLASGQPILFTEHGRHFPDYPRRKRMIFNRVLLRRRDRVIGVGEAVRQALIANEGIPAQRVGVIYNGIDLKRFTLGSDERDELRQTLGLDPGTLTVIQVARLDYLKDHLTAVRTMGRVVRQVPDVRLLLVGDGPERPAIQALVEELGLTEQVRFLGLRKDVERLLRAADLFLLTSISEGIPLTVIEAMALGLPVVSTRVGGVPEVVEDGRTGLLTTAADDTALSAAVLKLAADPELRTRLGQCGRERACSMFSEVQMAGRYRDLYEEMLRG